MAPQSRKTASLPFFSGLAQIAVGAAVTCWVAGGCARAFAWRAKLRGTGFKHSSKHFFGGNGWLAPRPSPGKGEGEEAGRVSPSLALRVGVDRLATEFWRV